MRARPSLSLLLFSLPSLLSCAPSPSSPPASAPPVTDPDAAYRVESEPVPPPTSGEPLTVHLARHNVSALVFFDRERVFLANELGEFFASSDAGESWVNLPGPRIRGLSVANRSELWAANNWSSPTTGKPGGRVMHSTDAGRSWTIIELEPEKHEGDAIMVRSPLAFVNNADEPPLLVMADGVYVEPAGGRPFEQWPRLGTPGFASAVAAVDRRGRLYAVATQEYAVAMSSDRGKSWQRAPLPGAKGRVEKLACGDDACFLLAIEPLEATQVFRASAGTNAWTLMKVFERRAFAEVISASGAAHGTEFTVCGFAATGDKLVFAGYGVAPDYPSQWSATFTLAPDGTLASATSIDPGEPRYAEDTMCKLTPAPDGSFWAAGRGAFRLEGGEWRRRWRYPGEMRTK